MTKEEKESKTNNEVEIVISNNGICCSQTQGGSKNFLTESL